MPSAVIEDELAGRKREGVEAIDVQIDSLEELIDIASMDAISKNSEIALGIDVAGHCCQRIDLGTPQGADGGGSLSVEVSELEGIEVGDAEARDTETCQRREMNAANAAHPGYRHALV